MPVFLVLILPHPAKGSARTLQEHIAPKAAKNPRSPQIPA